MKKIAVITLALLLISFALTSCSSKDVNSKPAVSPAASTEPTAKTAANSMEISFDDIEKANSFMASTSEGQIVTVNIANYGNNGSESSSEFYSVSLSSGKYAATYQSSAGYTEYYNGECTYSYDSSSNSLGTKVYLDGQENDCISTLSTKAFSLNPESQTITESVQTGDSITVTMTSAFDDSNKLQGYSSYRYVYVLEPDTLKIKSYEIYAESEGGTAEPFLTAKAIVTKNSGIVAAPDFITELTRPESTRSILLIVSPGTDSEKEYTFTVSSASIFAVGEYEGYSLFSDAGGTSPHEADSGEPPYADATIYMIAN